MGIVEDSDRNNFRLEIVDDVGVEMDDLLDSTYPHLHVPAGAWIIRKDLRRKDKTWLVLPEDKAQILLNAPFPAVKWYLNRSRASGAAFMDLTHANMPRIVLAYRQFEKEGYRRQPKRPSFTTSYFSDYDVPGT